MYVVIYCSFIFSLCIFIFYFSSEILAKFSYSVNPRLNKVYVCMYVCMYVLRIFFPKGRKQILMGTTICNSKHLCKIPQGTNLYKINFNVFNVCLCCQKSLVIYSLYVCFLFRALSPAKTIAPNFQLLGFGNHKSSYL